MATQGKMKNESSTLTEQIKKVIKLKATTSKFIENL